MHTAFTDSISALMLLANANFDSSQRVSILAAAASSSDFTSLTDCTDGMLQLVKYVSIAIALRQCDNQRNTEMYDCLVTASTASTFGIRNSNDRKCRGRRYNCMIREQVGHAKSTRSCKSCGRYGRWSGDSH